jgi:hypothetical protein
LAIIWDILCLYITLDIPSLPLLCSQGREVRTLIYKTMVKEASAEY